MTDSKLPVLYTSLTQNPVTRALMESAAVLLTKAEKFQTIPSDADAEVASEFRARLNQCIKDLDKQRLADTEEHRKLVAKLNAEANEKLVPMNAVLEKTDKVIKAYLTKKDEERRAALQAQQDEEARIDGERVEAEKKAEAARQAAQKAALDVHVTQAALAVAVSPEVRDSLQEQLESAVATQQQAMRVAAVETAVIVQLEQRQDVLASLPALPDASKSIRGSHGSTTGLRDNWVWKLTDISKVPSEYLLPPEERLAKSVLNAKARSIKKASTDAVPGIEIYNDRVTASRVGR